VFGSVLV